MEIIVNIGEMDLNTVIGKKVRFDSYEETDVEDDLTLGDVVVKAVIDKAMASRYPSVEELVQRIREEQVRQATAEQLQAALAKPYRRTNVYGEVKGDEGTLAELIHEKVEQLLTTKHSYDRREDPVFGVVKESVAVYLQGRFTAQAEEAIQKYQANLLAAHHSRMAALVTKLEAEAQTRLGEYLKELDRGLAARTVEAMEGTSHDPA